MKPVNLREARALSTGVALIVAAVLPGFLMASLAPRIRLDFSFDASELGLAVALFYAASAIASSSAGRLVDRVGAVLGMRLAASLLVVACLGGAVLANSTFTLAGAAILAGVGNAIAGPGVTAMLNREMSQNRRGMAFGAMQAGAPLGAMLAGLALPSIAIPLDWRWAYVAAALIAIAAVTLAPAGPSVRAPSAQPGGRKRLGYVHALALAAVLASAAGVGFISFLVTYAIEEGIAEGPAGFLLGAVSMAAVISRIAVGAIADRGTGQGLGLVAAMLGASVAGYLLLIAGSPAAIAIGALVVGLIGWGWPGALTHAVVERAPGAPAWAMGVMMSGLFAGAIAGPLLIGLLAERDAFAAAWLACSALAVAAAAIVALTGARSRRSPQVPRSAPADP
jgi:MFS family permease